MKIFILSFFKHLKSFNNLLLNLTIKSISSFSYIVLVRKYYSYFRFILEYFKGWRFYNIFKAFFKVIALINILLGIFTLIVFTDFRYDDYKIFINNNIINFSFNDFVSKLKNYFKRVLKKLINIFDDDSVIIDKPESVKIPDNYKLPNQDTDTKSYKLYYYLFGGLFCIATVIVCINYPDYTVTPVVTAITGFFSSFFSRGGGTGDNLPDSGPNPLDKGKGRDLGKLDVDHLRPFPSSSPSSTKSLIGKYFPIFDKTVSSIGADPNDLITGNEWGKTSFSSDSSSSSSDSSSSTETVKQSHIPYSSTSSTSSTPAPSIIISDVTPNVTTDTPPSAPAPKLGATDSIPNLTL
jgi:hypothetical protein